MFCLRINEKPQFDNPGIAKEIGMSYALVCIIKHQSISQSINQSINQSISQSINQSVNQAVVMMIKFSKFLLVLMQMLRSKNLVG